MSHSTPPPLAGERGQVGPVARALGFAGLLPQIAVAWLAMAEHPAGQPLAFLYGGLIFSFVGGMWWGFAMRRQAGQGALVTAAVVPSLVVLGLAVLIVWRGAIATPLVLLGAAILLTLIVDHHLFRRGEVPTGWMALRVPLSIGLGLLTIVAGVV